MPYFSLILPCYKVAAYLARCVRSILAQDFTDYEIILVDDGSPDETPVLCDRLAEEQPCIRVIHKENGGLSSARNAGLAAALGKYIWFVDSDDWIGAGALALLHRTCEDSRAEIVKFSHFRVTDHPVCSPHSVSAGLYEGKARCDQLRCEALRKTSRYCLSAWSHVYRNDFLKKHRLTFVSERRIGSEDYLFNLQALFCVQRLYVLPDALYSYELRPGSLTQTYKPDLPQRFGELHRQMTEYAHQCGMPEYLPLIDRFYLWHLIVSICFSQEYLMVTPTHQLPQGRKNVRAMLRLQQVRKAAHNAERSGLTWKKRLQLMAIWLRQEGLFCCLYRKRR